MHIAICYCNISAIKMHNNNNNNNNKKIVPHYSVPKPPGFCFVEAMPIKTKNKKSCHVILILQT